MSGLATLSPDQRSARAPPAVTRRHRRRVTAKWAAASVTCYLILGVIAYWGAWSGGAARTSLCGGCGDIAQSGWFLAWTPYAVLHGHNPLFTTWVNYPHGVNLMDNASIILPSLLVAPVTLIFGPLVSFNLLATLAFTGSATTAFFVFRRFTSWLPAAFLGGLIYGFSPYMVNQEYAHINLTLVAIPPLVLLVLDEVMIRQRGRAIPWGIALGLLVVGQFFTSSEILASTAIMAAIGVIVLLLTNRGRVQTDLRHISVSLLVAGVVAAAFLAFPVYFLLAGPQHINGPAQEGLALYSGNLGGPIVPHASMLLHTTGSAKAATTWFGTVDFVEDGTYLGVPLLLLLVLIGVRFWRQQVVRFGLSMAIAAFVLALGPRLHVGTMRTSVWLAFGAFEHASLLKSLVPVRFMLYVDLFIALVLAVAVDRARGAGLWPARGNHLKGLYATKRGARPRIRAIRGVSHDTPQCSNSRRR